jgi:molecular chaperone GrpE (heat shock protein)
MSSNDFTNQLLALMQQVGIPSFKALSKSANVSERQLLRLRRGEIKLLRVDVLLKLSQTLQVSLNELLETFSVRVSTQTQPSGSDELLQQIADLQAEYQRSQQQLSQQQVDLQQQFQQSSVQLLESLLLQFPTAAHKARENPQLEAVKILPLIEKPLSKLLQAWGIQAIAFVGAEVPYDPVIHQLIEGQAHSGQIVKVRYIGYRQGDKLLYRAKVSA